MTRTGFAYPVAAWLTVHLGSSLLENLLDRWPSGSGSTRHERRTITGTLLATRNAGANEKKTFSLKFLRAADRVGVVRVTTINDNIALLEMGLKLLNEVINGLAGLHKEHNLAGSLKLRDEFLNRVSTLNVGAYCAMGRIKRGSARSMRTEANLWPR